MTVPNQFYEHWHPELLMDKKDWHQNIRGVYHISTIGCSHNDLRYTEHSGPCLRQTYWEYTDPIPNSPETEGNFEMGKDIHEKLQGIIMEWYPHAIIEYALAKIFEKEEQKILLVGSIDVVYRHLFDLEKDNSKTKRKISIWDIKSASNYTFPKGRFDKNPTHFNQIYIYGGMMLLFELHPDSNEIVRMKILYVDKHNKKTFAQREKFNTDKSLKKLADCVDRAFYLDKCIEKEEVPVPEPMKWCKFCKYLDRCISQGDVEPIMHRKRIVGLKCL